jgi:diaminopimelate epimerase
VSAASPQRLRFTKMHGIGNDFVVVDARTQPFDLTVAEIRHVGDRHTGVGFDQLLTIEPASDASCAFRYGIYNTDGSTAGQCGNGVRCVAVWLARAGALRAGATRLQSPSGAVAVELLDDARVRVAMGVPDFAPAAIPLRVEAEASSYRLDVAGHHVELGAVSMGNPHAVIVVDDVATAPVESLGAQLEMHADFPDRCNVGFVQALSRTRVLLRVWERGVGETLACGSGACAAMAVLRRRGLVDDRVTVALPGGELEIEWPGQGELWMTGPAQFVFEGEWHFHGR